MAKHILTPAQYRAVHRLKYNEWLSAYEAKASLATLNALVKCGLAESEQFVGSQFFPRTNILFRRKRK